MKTPKKNTSIHLLETTGLWVGYGALIIYLVANIALSQLISPLYFTFVKKESSAIVPFLVSIKSLPIFDSKLLLYKNLYGAHIEGEVFTEELRKNALINNFERILKINPSARDIYYNLSVLFRARGDEKKSNEYFQKAKMIDPSIDKK